MSAPRVAIALGLAVALVGGCSAAYQTEQADREVYHIIADKNAEALGRVPDFSLQPRTDLAEVLKKNEGAAPAKETVSSPAVPKAADGEKAAAARLPDGQAAPAPPSSPPAAPSPAPTPAKNAAAPPAAPSPTASPPAQPGEAAPPDFKPPADLPSPVPEPGPSAVRLTVADALRVAVRASRDYQSAKETVYLAALTLTFNRYLFQPHPTFAGTVNFNNTDNAGHRLRTWDGSSDIGVSQQLADGAVVVGSLGLAALKFLSPQLADTVDSTLSFSLTQPLWRGAGRRIVQENLVQAERNAGYAVRTFARYEQDFAVAVASQYLRVLQQRDVVLNTWRNYLSLKMGRERAEWLAQAERVAEFEVDQARQDELRAYNTWIVEREDYVNALDAFKITLGIPVTTEIAPESGELDRLTALGLQQMAVRLADATAKALETRLDLKNSREGLEDADRKVFIAEDGLKGDVDLVASIGYASRGEAPQSARLSLRRGDYAVGFNIDLPIDRLQERNALRQTQITREQARRANERLRDDITLAVSRALRRLEQARESYEIQKRSVSLGERRVESTQLLLQAGRTTQRYVLDAERDLLAARNALTSALVAHSIAGLEFQRDVGTLVVDEEGQIHGWNLTDGGR